MTYSEKLIRQLKERGLKKQWLAEKIGLRYGEFWKRAMDNSFSKEEKTKIKIFVGEDSYEREQLMRQSQIRVALKRLAKTL